MEDSSDEVVNHGDYINLSDSQKCNLSEDFYDSHWFECVQCPTDILKIPFYLNVGLIFKNICESLMTHLEEDYENIEFPSTAYGFFSCPDGDIHGACGAEVNPEDNNERLKLYINPLIIVETDPQMLSFEKIFQIAVHEMSHAFLHVFNSKMYPLAACEHPSEFIVLCHEMQLRFYDKVKLCIETWVS